MAKKYALLILCSWLFISTYAQISSNFSTDNESWGTIVVSSGIPAVAANYNSTGGNPGGYISADVTNPTTPYYFFADRYFDAPAKFLGNKSFSYNQNLTFDLQQSLSGTDVSTAEVILTGGGISIFLPVTAAPAIASWSSYSVLLKETAGWKTGGLTGAATTLTQMKVVLANITSLRIKAQYFPGFPVGNYSCRLDNVVLNQATVPVPPAITSFSPASGVPGTSVTITGTNFNPSTVQNVVYFNGVRGAVVNASATQLTVTSPSKTSFGPITVTNLANSTQGTSSQNFNPLFDNNKDFGGRIIPSSFARRVDFGTSINEVGMSVADLDGDGWNDVLTSGNNLNASVFRNLGQTGAISASSFAAALILSIPNGISFGVPSAVARVGQNAIADMDGDGKLDLVINVGYNQGGNYDNGMVVFLNQSTPGNLSFSSGSVFQFSTVNNNNQGISVVDIDGDGRPEFLGALNNSACHLGIAQNLSTPGNLDFAAIQDFAGGSTMGGPISWGDLNGDGKPEIISEAYLGGAVYVWENLSVAGTISMGTPFSVSTLTANNFQVIDFDNDGKSELFFKDSFSGIIHIKKNGHTAGSLTATDFTTDIQLTSFYSSGGNTGYVGVADLNGDNLIDVVANNGTHMIVYQNKFSGTLSSSSFALGVTFEGQDFSNAQVICADIDGDNKPEILVKPQTNGTGKNFRVYRNECFPAPRIDSITPSSGIAGSSVNFAGDHFLTGTGSPSIAGKLGPISTTIVPSSNTAATSVIASAIGSRFTFSEHGLTAYSAPFNVLFNTNRIISSSSFGTGIDFPLSTTTRDAITVADFDDDGKTDVAVVDNGFTTKIFQNTQAVAGQSITSASFTQFATTYTGGITVIAMDVDGDGKTDLNNGTGWLQNNSTTGSISFLAAVTTSANGSNYAPPVDFNKDGKMDLAVNKGGANVDVYENQSTTGTFSNNGNFGTFSASTPLARAGTNGAITAADFDGDGYEDILAVNQTTDNISVFLNTKQLNPISSTTFQSLGTISTAGTGKQPISITANDFDGDGKTDIAVAYYNNTFVSVYLNTSVIGNITFGAAVNLTCLTNGYNIASQDLDGDGKAEIIITHTPNPGSFSIFKNNSTIGNAAFAAVVNFPITRNPQGLAIADINQDQKPDILLVTNGGSTAPFNALTVFENKMALPAPTISSFTPATGPIGTTVTITGTNFDPISSNNTVKFNGATAVVTASTTTSITTLVPSGASSGTITVTVAGSTATSATNFTVTPHVPLGNVVLMNGSTDYIEVADHASLRPTNLTLEAWVNFSSLPSSGFAPILNKVLGNGINDSYQLFYSNGVLKATVEDVVGFNTFVQLPFNPVVGQWYHVAFTYDDATRSEKLYLDGALVAINTVGASPQYDNSPLYIGGDRDNGTTYYSFPGKIDEARIWNVVRSSTEILSMMNASLSGNETGLSAYYKMDETGQGSGITVTNSSLSTGAVINGTTFGTTCTPIFTLQPLPTISSFSPTSGPNGTLVAITGTNFDATAVNNIVSFNGIASIVTASTTTSITTTVPVNATSGSISVTVGCNVVTSASAFTVTASPIITINPQPTPVYSVCDGATSIISTSASGTTNLVYQWQFSPDGIVPFTDLNNAGGYSNAATSSISINTTGIFGSGKYRCKISGDLAATVFTNTVSFTVNALPAQPTTQGASGCSGNSIALTASGGVNGQYVWYLVSTGGTSIAGETSSVYQTPSLTSTTTYYVSIKNATCESTRTAVTATIDNTNCNLPVIAPKTVGTQIGGVVTLNLLPLITTVNNNLDINSITVTVQPSSGAIASVTNGVLTINYNGIAFSGTEPITIQACDTNSNCTTQVFNVDVFGDIVVYNALSPNGMNPTFVIEYINLLPDTKNNTVYIFDRWQNEVWRGTNYDNSSVVFSGASNDGTNLPTGVYFYKINFDSGRKAQTGFISLRRQ